MARSTVIFPAVPFVIEGRKERPQERTSSLADGSPALIRERLDTLAAAFLSDMRPALLFECGRLIFANDAARTLLGSNSAGDRFLEALKVSIGNGVIKTGLLLNTRAGIYAPVLQSGPRNQPTRICFLIRRSEETSVSEALSKRERGVLTLLLKGLTNGQIAEELGISIETVRKHISHALEKTGSKTRAGLVGRALGDSKNVTRSGY